MMTSSLGYSVTGRR